MFKWVPITIFFKVKLVKVKFFKIKFFKIKFLKVKFLKVKFFKVKFLQGQKSTFKFFQGQKSPFKFFQGQKSPEKYPRQTQVKVKSGLVVPLTIDFRGDLKGEPCIGLDELFPEEVRHP